MAWETALDRLLLQQIHLAEKGEVRPQDVRQQILDLHRLRPERPETAFHMGYARALLGLEMPEPTTGDSPARWFLFGRMRGHDRRGERNWVADLLQDPTALMELLHEPRIAAQCLPLVMRTLFWCGDLTLAVRAIDYLSAGSRDSETEVLVDAALTDLLTRLEYREDREDTEPTATILLECIELASFDRLPADVRARYHRALAIRMLAASEFEEAAEHLEAAEGLAAGAPRLRSSISALRALAALRLHDLRELEPRSERDERDQALAILGTVGTLESGAVADALFVRGILAYEVGDYETAGGCFDEALRGYRRRSGRDTEFVDRARFFLAASILAGADREQSSRALRLMDQALDSVRPDLESFYPVHEALKELDRKLAIKFLDAVDVGRGTAPDQLLFVGLEYLALGEAKPASAAAERVLQVAVNLDQRVEALRILLTARNMQGDRAGAREIFDQIRDLLVRRGALAELENLLKNEEFVGQALDSMEIKCELVALYEEMEDREFEKAMLQAAIARSLRARKDASSLQEAFGILKEVEIHFPDLARDELRALEKLLELQDTRPSDPQGTPGIVARIRERLGRAPRVLVVGGNERQRRHHPRFAALAEEWGFEGEWLMADYTSPQKLVAAIAGRLDAKIDVLLLLHWNRHETTEPALDLARRRGVPARTVHYAGFTSLQVSLADQFERMAATPATA